MTFLTIRLASIAAALLALAGCMHSADIHCDYVNGGWRCEGAAGGTAPKGV